MKISDDRFEISNSESIPWEDVKTLRLLNEKLAFELTDGRTVELSNLRPSTIDTAFRTYERYLKDHPEKRKR
jgi:hypothetical protein